MSDRPIKLFDDQGRLMDVAITLDEDNCLGFIIFPKGSEPAEPNIEAHGAMTRKQTIMMGKAIMEAIEAPLESKLDRIEELVMGWAAARSETPMEEIMLQIVDILGQHRRSTGDLTFFRNWQDTIIKQYGKSYYDELMKRATQVAETDD